MKIIFKIILALLVAVNLSFATDDYNNSWEKKTIPKKFLNKDCRKLVKKIFCESKSKYVSDTITNMWKEPILMIFFPPEPELREIEPMKSIRGLQEKLPIRLSLSTITIQSWKMA